MAGRILTSDLQIERETLEDFFIYTYLVCAHFDTSDATPIFHFRPYALQHVTIDFRYDSDDSSSYPYGERLRTPSFYFLYHRVCLNCEDKSWLPSQKRIVTCCGGHGRKWIIGLTSVVSTRADKQSTEVDEQTKTWRVSLSICR